MTIDREKLKYAIQGFDNANAEYSAGCLKFFDLQQAEAKFVPVILQAAREYLSITEVTDDDKKKSLDAVKAWEDSINYDESSGKPHVYVDSEKVLYENSKIIIAALMTGDAWQTIDTAPKDGTDILIMNGNGKVFRGKCKPENDEEIEWWEEFNSLNVFYSPTHWMPLPPEPVKDKGE